MVQGKENLLLLKIYTNDIRKEESIFSKIGNKWCRGKRTFVSRKFIQMT